MDGDTFILETGRAISVTSSPCEKAILSWSVKLGIKFTMQDHDSPSFIHFHLIQKKKGGVVVHVGRSKVHWKEAAEIVLATCARWLNSNA